MRKFFIASFLFLLSITAPAQNKLTPELLWKIRRIGEFQVSPDGKNIAFALANYDVQENKGNTDIYLIPVGGGAPRQLTNLKGNENNARWRPDGKKIGFLSTESGSSQLWEMNPDGSDMKKISNFKSDITMFGYAPTMNYISFAMEVKLDKTVREMYPDLPKVDARIIDDLFYRHWNAWHDYHYTHACYAPYRDGEVVGEVVDVMPGEKFDVEEITFDKEGKKLIYTSKKLIGKQFTLSTNTDIYAYDLGNQQTRNLTEGMKGYDRHFALSPDGQKLAFISMERDGFEADKERLIVYDLKTGKKEDLTKNYAENAGEFVWSLDGKKIFFGSVIKGTVQLCEVELSTGKVTQLTDVTANYNGIALADKFFISSKTTHTMPNELVKIDAKSLKEEQLTFVNKDLLASVVPSKVEKRMVKTTDGKEMLVWVIFPPDFDPSKKYPALLYCQGGPQSPVTQSFSYRWNFWLMASQGYIVVAPNRRGLQGFGQEWNAQISGDWGGQAITDYLSAIDDVAKENYVNKDKLGAVGASYGGYSVYYLAGHHNKRFKTFIAHCGLFNLESWYGATEELFFANWDMQGSYWQNPKPESYTKFSPHHFVKNWDTPILVIHNERDFRVPIGEGLQAFQAAQLQNLPSRFLYFPDEGHWILKPQNSILWNRVFFDWLDKWLKE